MDCGFIVKSKSVFGSNNEGLTALHLAASFGNDRLEILRYLLGIPGFQKMKEERDRNGNT